MSSAKLADGWVGSPDGRGTLDVLWSSLLTILLCSWSVLCLNIPRHHGYWRNLAHKCLWVLFTVFFPEVITALAAEQWTSARQSVEDFNRSKFANRGFAWTTRHAFFADMGGFRLQEQPPTGSSYAPPFRDVPVNAVQIQWLADKGYIEWPNVSEDEIRDKNKADGFARLLTVVQIIWFAISCIGRAVQQLPISSLELGTIAYVFASIPT